MLTLLFSFIVVTNNDTINVLIRLDPPQSRHPETEMLQSCPAECLNFCYILPEVDDRSLVWMVLRTMLLGAYSVEQPDRKFRIQ